MQITCSLLFIVNEHILNKHEHCVKQDSNKNSARSHWLLLSNIYIRKNRWATKIVVHILIKKSLLLFVKIFKNRIELINLLGKPLKICNTQKINARLVILGNMKSNVMNMTDSIKAVITAEKLDHGFCF